MEMSANIRTGLHILASVFVAFICVLAPKASPFILVSLWIVLIFAKTSETVQDALSSKLLLPLSLLMGWALLSVSWSLTPFLALKATSLATLLSLAALGLCTHVSHLSSTQNQSLIRFITTTVFFALAIWAIEILTQGKLLFFAYLATDKDFSPILMESIYKPTSYALGGLSVLLTAWLFYKKKYILTSALVILTLTLIALSHSTTAFLGTLLGFSTLFLGRRYYRTALTFLLSLILVNLLLPILIFTLPVTKWGEHLYTVLGDQFFSFYHRLIIWDFTIKSWLLKPLMGWGVGSSKVIPGSEAEIIPGARILSLHPHNHILQTGLEMGLVGLCLLAVFLFAILKQISISFKSSAAKSAALALFTTLFIYGAAEHSLWHHWWLAWMGIYACICVLICNAIERDFLSGRK